MDIKKKIGTKIVYDHSVKLVYSTALVGGAAILNPILTIPTGLFFIYNLERFTNLMINKEIASAGYIYDKADKYGILNFAKKEVKYQRARINNWRDNV